MYIIKQSPEDFVVREIIDEDSFICDSGQFSYFWLEKRDYSTVSALGYISKRISKPLKFFGFAGNKDKVGVTRQLVSIKFGGKQYEGAYGDGISLAYVGQGIRPVSLGELDGNHFEIVVRNISGGQIADLKKLDDSFLLANYFGNQRFSRANHIIGKHVVKGSFDEATRVMLEFDGGMEQKIRAFLEKEPNNFVGALNLIPLKTRRIFVHAYQSLLFNIIVKKMLSSNNNLGDFVDVEIPLIGFGYEGTGNKDVDTLVDGVMGSEGLAARDFVIRSMPELSSEGTVRRVVMKVKEFAVIESGGDWVRVGFCLPKGSYATVVLDLLLECGKDIFCDSFDFGSTVDLGK